MFYICCTRQPISYRLFIFYLKNQKLNSPHIGMGIKGAWVVVWSKVIYPHTECSPLCQIARQQDKPFGNKQRQTSVKEDKSVKFSSFHLGDKLKKTEWKKGDNIRILMLHLPGFHQSLYLKEQKHTQDFSEVDRDSVAMLTFQFMSNLEWNERKTQMGNVDLNESWQVQWWSYNGKQAGQLMSRWKKIIIWWDRMCE